jgi:dolichol kinase
MTPLELRRQILHILYGPLLIVFYELGLLNLTLMLALIMIGGGTSYMIYKKRFNPIARVLAFFERKHHMEKFPGRGILFFTIGAFISLLLFEKNVAYAGIMILSIGDAVSNIAGRHLGHIKTKLNPKKYIEGSFLGILVSIPIAYHFFPHWGATIAASVVAMFLEIPYIKIYKFEIDDNLMIPVAASFTIHLFT